MTAAVERLSTWASESTLRTLIASLILLVYVIIKIPSALKEWGNS